MPEPQELFLEDMVQRGDAWLIDAPEGYAVTCEGMLVEFHVAPSGEDARLAAFDAVVAASGVHGVYLKSFDGVLLALAGCRAGPLSEVGLLFRRCEPVTLPELPALRLRPAAQDDLPAALGLDPEFFDDLEEVAFYAGSDDAELILFHGEDGVLAGCGISRTVVAGRPGTDIGMVVAPDRRGRGVGTAIVAAMRDRVAARGGRAICGCDIDNIASRRCLERAGFRTDHVLLEGTLHHG
jgi:RimJ/RimL family protein N-acetyltransferase